MAEFVMPALGADMSIGTLLKWLKQPGETVARGDIIAVVHTDKADVEVEVFTGGVLERVLVDPGAEVPVGTVLAVIREDGAPTAPAAALAAPAPAPAAPARAGAAPHVIISPSARHLAEELGIDPALIHGSGPGGRIQRKDVEAAAAARETAALQHEIGRVGTRPSEHVAGLIGAGAVERGIDGRVAREREREQNPERDRERAGAFDQALAQEQAHAFGQKRRIAPAACACAHRGKRPTPKPTACSSFYPILPSNARKNLEESTEGEDGG